MKELEKKDQETVVEEEIKIIDEEIMTSIASEEVENLVEGPKEKPEVIPTKPESHNESEAIVNE